MDWRYQAIEAADECAAKAREQIDRVDRAEGNQQAVVIQAVCSISAAWSQLGLLYTQLAAVLPDPD